MRWAELSDRSVTDYRVCSICTRPLGHPVLLLRDHDCMTDGRNEQRIVAGEAHSYQRTTRNVVEHKLVLQQSRLTP